MNLSIFLQQIWPLCVKWEIKLRFDEWVETILIVQCLQAQTNQIQEAVCSWFHRDFACCGREKRTVVVCTWQTPPTQLIYMKTITTTRHKVQTWLDYSHNYTKLVVMTLTTREYTKPGGQKHPELPGITGQHNGIIVKNQKHIFTAGREW